MRQRLNTSDSCDSGDLSTTDVIGSYASLQTSQCKAAAAAMGTVVVPATGLNTGPRDPEAVGLLEEEEGPAGPDDGDISTALVFERDTPAEVRPTNTGSTTTAAMISEEENEPSWSIALQVFIPYIVAGVGMVAAGLLLDYVQHWKVFKQVSEVFILVPSLLGLKGNLEMTLASRLSTQANLGNLRTRSDQFHMVYGNLALIQVQAIVVGILAAFAAMIFGWIPEGKFDFHHGLLLCTSSVFTASVASLILGTVMSVVVILSHSCYVNPDNIATPIAASLGDLTTLALLAGITSLLYRALDGHLWLAPTLLIVFLVVAVVCFRIAHHNSYTKDVLYSGWTPVIGAMVISSIGGLILDFTVSKYSGIAVYQPVINGVGGNLVAVQASRLSTSLHKHSVPGKLPQTSPHGMPSMYSTYFSKGLNARMNRVLLLLVVPGHLIFICMISYLNAGHTSTTPIFISFYLCASLIQVVILLYFGMYLVHWFWGRGMDPDNHAIPYLTAMGDLLGTLLLAVTFQILYLIGDRDTDVGD